MTRTAFVSLATPARRGEPAALGVALADTERWSVRARAWSLARGPARMTRAVSAGLRRHEAIYAASAAAADAVAAALDRPGAARFPVHGVEDLLAATSIPGATAPDQTAEAWDNALEAAAARDHGGAHEAAAEAARLAEAHLRVTASARDIIALDGADTAGTLKVELIDRRSGDDRLYGGDFYAWTQDQAARLRRNAEGIRALDPAIDPEQLAEEIADHGRDELHEVRQALVRTISQLLEHARDCANRSWEHEAELHQNEAIWFFSEGMRADLDMAQIHAKAVKMANAVFKSRGLTPLPHDEPLPLGLDDLVARDVPFERHAERLRSWISNVVAPASVH